MLPWDHVISLASTIISLVGLFFVALQLHVGNRQRESDSLVKLYDINRELMALGFSHPVLFKILDDHDDVDPLWQTRYLQLWLNQLSLSFTYMQRTVAQPELKESIERNLVDFMTMKNMRRHWHEKGHFYPLSFQKHVNELLRKIEPPQPAAQMEIE